MKILSITKLAYDETSSQYEWIDQNLTSSVACAIPDHVKYNKLYFANDIMKGIFN